MATLTFLIHWILTAVVPKPNDGRGQACCLTRYNRKIIVGPKMRRQRANRRNVRDPLENRSMMKRRNFTNSMLVSAALGSVPRSLAQSARQAQKFEPSW